MTGRASGVARGILLLLVGTAACLAWADRVAFSVATDAIERELGFGDAAIGAIGGFGFAVLYAVAGIPLARIGDRGGRLGVLVGSVAGWSLFSALTGRASGFASLFAARIGVGLGEAGLDPSALPLLSSAFGPERRALAMAGFWACAYSGLVLGLWGGGVLIGAVGWRGMFEVFGAAGVPVAASIWWMGRRVGPGPGSGEAGKVSPGPILADLALVLRAPGMGSLLLYAATGGVVAWGGLVWDTPFYMRHFHLDAGQAGFWFGNVFGIATALGTLLGGPVAQFVASRWGGGPASVRFAMWAYVAGQPFQVLAYATDDLALSLVAMAAATVSGALTVGPVFAALLGRVEPRHGGLATVAYGMASTLVGAALGPPVFGLLSDWLRPSLGAGSLQAALIVGAAFGFWPAVHLRGLARRMA